MKLVLSFVGFYEKKRKNKTIILETGRDLFWKFSFKDISVDYICEVAKVNKGTFYSYYESKVDLCLQVIDHNYKMLIEEVFERSFSETNDPIARYEGIIRRVYNLQKGFHDNEGRCRGCPFINLAMELSNQEEFVWEKLTEVSKRISKYFAEIYLQLEKKGMTTVKCDKDEMARKILYVFNGSLVSSKIKNKPELILEAIPTAKVLLGSA
jgi:TetR/AcrR family transcriptional regulator, transcriptional repressor for nem operon